MRSSLDHDAASDEELRPRMRLKISGAMASSTRVAMSEGGWAGTEAEEEVVVASTAAVAGAS